MAKRLKLTRVLRDLNSDKLITMYPAYTKAGIDSGPPWPSPYGRLLRRRLPGLSCPVIEPLVLRTASFIRPGLFVKYQKGPAFGGAFLVFGGEAGIRTLDRLQTYAGFQDRCIQPLCHLSKIVWCVLCRARIQKNALAYHPCKPAYDS